MRKLFFGFLLMFLSFDLEINGHSLDVLPDFAGYLLLLQGMREMESESRLFQSARPFAVGMAVYTAILWVGELLAVTGEGWLLELLNFIAMIVALYIAWVLIQAVQEMEGNRTADLNSRGMYRYWKGLAAVQVMAELLSLMANLANIGILVGLLALVALAGFVLNILYLVAWWKSTKAYEALPKRMIGPEI